MWEKGWRINTVTYEAFYINHEIHLWFVGLNRNYLLFSQWVYKDNHNIGMHCTARADRRTLDREMLEGIRLHHLQIKQRTPITHTLPLLTDGSDYCDLLYPTLRWFVHSAKLDLVSPASIPIPNIDYGSVPCL